MGRSALLCAIIATLLFVSEGATIFVKPTGTDSSTCGQTEAAACASIGYAVGLLNTPDSGDTVLLLPGTHLTASETAVNSELTIEGNGKASIVCTKENRAFSFAESAVVSGVTISNCSTVHARYKYGGGLSVWDQYRRRSVLTRRRRVFGVTVRNSVIRNCKSEGFGGGLFVYEAKVSLTNCTFKNNHAVYGGGIYSQGTGTYTVELDQLEMYNSTFENNNAISYGGGAAGSYQEVIIENCSFRANRVGNTSVVRGKGGGIYCRQTTNQPETMPWLMRNSSFIGNSATGNGGGVYLDYVKYGNFDALTVSDNTAELAGGGIMFGYQSEPNVTNILVERNVASYGGGVAFSGVGSSPISSSVIRNNIVIGTWDKATQTLLRNLPGSSQSLIVSRDNHPQPLTSRSRLKRCPHDPNPHPLVYSWRLKKPTAVKPDSRLTGHQTAIITFSKRRKLAPSTRTATGSTMWHVMGLDPFLNARAAPRGRQAVPQPAPH